MVALFAWCINLARVGGDRRTIMWMTILPRLKKTYQENFQQKAICLYSLMNAIAPIPAKLHDAMKELLPKQPLLVLPALRFSRLINQTASALLGHISILTNITRRLPTRWFWIYVMKLAGLIKILLLKTRLTNGLKNAHKGLTDVAKAELKRRWGTMQSLLSSRSRLEKVVFDILDDFYKKDRLASGRGNAMLVASSIHEACQYYEIFQTQGFTKCAVVTSYEPGALSTQDREYVCLSKNAKRQKHGRF